MSINFLCVTLWHMSICTRVVVSVTFQQVDGTPNAETGTQSDNQSLKNTNSRIKESHKSTSENIFFDLDFGRHIHSTIIH